MTVKSSRFAAIAVCGLMISSMAMPVKVYAGDFYTEVEAEGASDPVPVTNKLVPPPLDPPPPPPQLGPSVDCERIWDLIDINIKSDPGYPLTPLELYLLSICPA